MRKRVLMSEDHLDRMMESNIAENEQWRLITHWHVSNDIAAEIEKFNLTIAILRDDIKPPAKGEFVGVAYTVHPEWVADKFEYETMQLYTPPIIK